MFSRMTLLVSIPLRYAKNGGGVQWPERLIPVSIPLRYAKNGRELEEKPNDYPSFNSS